jgi:hypothetical protein
VLGRLLGRLVGRSVGRLAAWLPARSLGGASRHRKAGGR